MNVADWLRALGLEQYEAAFRENDVDAELLRDLTEDDLKGLGVASIGHRDRRVAGCHGVGAGRRSSGVKTIRAANGRLRAAGRGPCSARRRTSSVDRDVLRPGWFDSAE
jgi:uncharacterized sporulation protein YeaH/YhbH (DUF444 family)